MGEWPNRRHQQQFKKSCGGMGEGVECGVDGKEIFAGFQTFIACGAGWPPPIKAFEDRRVGNEQGFAVGRQ